MRTWIFIAPVLVVGVLQVSGCTTTDTAITPSGAVYRSESAGALFEQSVALASPTEEGPTHIADIALKGAHRPTFSPDAVYVAAGANGYVVSNDDGQTWTAITVPLASVIDIVALEQDIIVVTGIDGQGQGYILRTADEGKSWQTVLTVPVPTKNTGVEAFRLGNKSDVATVVISIAPDPFDANRLYAGTSLGNIFVGEQFAKTWRKVHNVDNDAFSSNQPKFAVADLIPSPHLAHEMLIITTGGRLYYVQADGQQREIKIPQNTSAGPVLGLGQSKTVLSAHFIDQFPEALLVGVNDGAVISRDKGTTWEQLSLPVDTLKRFNTVIVKTSPSNANRILVAINDAVFRSEDAGQSWNTFSLNLPSHVITNLLINPENAANVVAITAPLAS